MMDNDNAWMYYYDQVVAKIDLNPMLKATEKICSALGFRLGPSQPTSFGGLQSSQNRKKRTIHRVNKCEIG